MRPLRDAIAGPTPLTVPGPQEPVAVLSVSVRVEPDQGQFDRVLFGLSDAEAEALGDIAPHLCEVSYEAFEASAVPMRELGARRVGVFVALPPVGTWTGREHAAVCEVFGLSGAAVALSQGECGPLLAIHLASTALRADDVELALVLAASSPGAPTGAVAAMLLARAHVAARAGWHIRSVILGSAVGVLGQGRPPLEIATQRAGIHADKQLYDPSMRELARTVRGHQAGEGRLVGWGSADETVGVHVIFAPPEPVTRMPEAPLFLALSARTPNALQDLARAVVDDGGSRRDLHGMAFDAGLRPSWEHRLAIPLDAPAERVRGRLARWLAGDGDVACQGRVERPACIAFVAPPAGWIGGSAHAGLVGEPAFRAALDEAAGCFDGGGSPFDGPPADVTLRDAWAVAVAWATAALLRHHGTIPEFVVGAGVGELAAAAICGALDLDIALKLAVEHGSRIASGDGCDAIAVPCPWGGAGTSDPSHPTWISGATGQAVDGPLTLEELASRLRAPVQLDRALRGLRDQGVTTVVDLAGSSDLADAVAEASGDKTMTWVPCSGEGAGRALPTILARLWVGGGAGPADRRPYPLAGRQELAPYPWDRQSVAAAQDSDSHVAIDAPASPQLWEEVWVPAVPPPGSGARSEGTFVLLADRTIDARLAAELRARGLRTVIVDPSDASEREDLRVGAPSRRGACEPVFDALRDMPGPIRIVHLWSLLEHGGGAIDGARGWRALLRMGMDLDDHQIGADRVRIVTITRNTGTHPDAAAFAGASRLLAAERPGIHGGFLDLGDDAAEDLAGLVDHLLDDGLGGCELALHRGAWMRRQLCRAVRPRDRGVVRPGTWFIVGDVDLPVVDLAAQLARQGIQRLVMASRDRPAPEVLRRVLQMQRSGVDCAVLDADPATPRGRSLLQGRLDGEPVLGGVVLRLSTPRGDLDSLMNGGLAAGRSEEATIDAAHWLIQQVDEAQLWIWTEGPAMAPVAGTGLGAVSGAAMRAMAARRLADGRPTTLLDVGVPSAEAIDWIGRLGPGGGILGLWRER